MAGYAETPRAGLTTRVFLLVSLEPNQSFISASIPRCAKLTFSIIRGDTWDTSIDKGEIYLDKFGGGDNNWSGHFSRNASIIWRQVCSLPGRIYRMKGR